MALTAPTNNFKANAPATVTLAANAADADGSVAKVEFHRINAAAPVYDASTLVGAADTIAPYEVQTGALVAGTYTFVARATDNQGGVATSGTVHVIVNALPTVTISSPAANASIGLGSTVTLRAGAGDADGSVTKVEFFIDGSATALPATQVLSGGTPTGVWERSWTNFSVGAHTIIARATDNDGAVQSTASVSVNVPANALPTVTLDDPSAGTNAPTTLALAAAATDSDGTVTEVAFFNGSTLLGNGVFDAATSRYRLSVPIGAAAHGTYTITARATDNLGGQRVTAYTITARATDTFGNTTTSAPQTLVVTANTESLWANLNAAQKAGLTQVPDSPIEDGGVDVGQVMTALGVTRYVPSFNPAMVYAARLLADFTPPTGPAVACAGGGTLEVSANPDATLPAGSRFHQYRNCVMGPSVTELFTYGCDTPAECSHTNNMVIPPVTAVVGAAVDYVALSPTSYRLVISGLRLRGNGAPQPGDEDYPRNAYPRTEVTCTGIGASKSCVTNMNNNFLWGNDISWTGWTPGVRLPPADPLHATDDTYVVSGTYRPQYGSATARHIRFEAMTNIGGRAVVYGNNGYSVVTRLAPSAPGVERLSVRRWLQAAITVNGITYPAGASDSGIYQCTVDAVSGDWGCGRPPAP